MGAYEEYVKRYAEGRGITIEEAEQHRIVKDVKESYECESDETVEMCGWSEERRINHACNT